MAISKLELGVFITLINYLACTRQLNNLGNRLAN